MLDNSEAETFIPEYSNEKAKTKKFRFTVKDDKTLQQLVHKYGTNSWKLISSKFKGRTARQCRERWNNYLNPETNQKKWTENEDEQLINLFSVIGPQWTKLTAYFNNRTSVNIRNRFRQIIKTINLNIRDLNSDDKNAYQVQLNNFIKYKTFQSGKKNENIFLLSKINLQSTDDMNQNQNQNICFIDQNHFNDLSLSNTSKESKIILPPCEDLPFCSSIIRPK